MDDSSSLADVYIDLGTSNTLVVLRRKGLVANEPTLIAYTESRPGKKKIVGVGFEAQNKVASNPSVFRFYKPLKEGVIADYDTTETLLMHYFEKLGLRGFLKKPRLVLSLPFGVTDVEKKATIQSGKRAGAKEVILIDEPMAAALGAGLPVQSAQGSMILDIGGGTTEVAVIALSDIVYCQSSRIGGHRFDSAIMEYLKKKRNLIVTDQVAEELKKKLGTATPKKDIRTEIVPGRDLDSGLQRSIEVSSEEMGLAMDSGLNEIINLIHQALEKTPPELVSDIIDSGITLTGGGSLIRDLDLRLQNEVRLPVHLTKDPLLTIARGGEMALKNPPLLEKIRLEV